MPRERKASVICCGLFRFSRGPNPSSGSTPSGSGEVCVELFGRPVATFADGLRECLPLLHVQFYAGQFHLGQSADGAELYPGDPPQLLFFEGLGQTFVQRKQDLRVAGGVFDLAPAEFPGPILPLAGLVHLLVQIALRHRCQGVGRALFARRPGVGPRASCRRWAVPGCRARQRGTDNRT